MPATPTDPAYDSLRSLLVRARREARLSQAEVANRLQKPQSYVSKIERGERQLDVVEFLHYAAALRIDAVALLERLQGASRGE